MKILFVLAALAMSMAAAAHNDSDTLIIKNPKTVKIITSDSINEVQVYGQEEDPTYYHSLRIDTRGKDYTELTNIASRDLGFGVGKLGDQKSSRMLTGDFAIGWSNAVGAPSEMDIRQFESAEIWLLVANYSWRISRYSKDRMSIGFGIDWRNYRMTGNRYFVKNAEGNLDIATLPAGSDPKFSRIKITSLTFPVLYQHSLGKDFGFSLGPVFNINISSSALTKYKLNGEKKKEKYSDVHATPITIDFMGILHNPIIDLYVKYSPMNALRTQHGPKFQSLSFGFFF